MKSQTLSINRTVAMAAAVAVFVFGLCVYGYAIQLPFRIDDFVHFRLLSIHTLANVWLGEAGLAYYRPLPFTIWKVINVLTGGFPPVVIHAINVICHALNGALVLALIYLHQSRTAKGLIVGSVAAVLFLLFPFSYQAVPWAGALTHPLVTLLMLASIVTAVRAQDGASRALRVISLAGTVLAPFAHETGVLVALGLTLFLVTSGRAKNLRELVARTWPYWLISLLAAGSMLAVRLHAGSPVAPAEMESRLQNGVYFVQGLAYPAAPIATRLLGLAPGLNDLGAVLLASVPVLALLAFVCVRLGQGRLVLFGLGWFLFMVTPAWLLLAFSYVVDGPRLMYEASLGAALFWSIPVAILVDRWASLTTVVKRLAAAIPAAVVVIGAVVGSAGFLAERADMYEQTRLASVGMLQAAVQPAEDKRNILSVNFPGWIAPKTATYALGHEGVSFIPEYSSPSDLVWAMTGVDSPMYNAVVTELQSHWRFNYLNYGSRWTAPDLQPQLRIARQVLFTSYRGQNLATYSAGRLEAENMARDDAVAASYDDRLAVRSGDWRIVPEGLLVTLHWQSWLTLTQEVRTFVHMRDAATGEMAAQEDGLPLMGLSNPLWWKPGDQWADTRLLVLPQTVRPGKYALWVGVYPADGSARLPALDAARHRLPGDEVMVGIVTIP